MSSYRRTGMTGMPSIDRHPILVHLTSGPLFGASRLSPVCGRRRLLTHFRHWPDRSRTRLVLSLPLEATEACQHVCRDLLALATRVIE